MPLARHNIDRRFSRRFRAYPRLPAFLPAVMPDPVSRTLRITRNAGVGLTRFDGHPRSAARGAAGGCPSCLDEGLLESQEAPCAPTSAPGELTGSTARSRRPDTFKIWTAAARSITPPQTPVRTLLKQTSTPGAPEVYIGRILKYTRPTFPQSRRLIIWRARRDSNP